MHCKNPQKNKTDEADLIEDADLKPMFAPQKSECGAKKACEHCNFYVNARAREKNWTGGMNTLEGNDLNFWTVPH